MTFPGACLSLSHHTVVLFGLFGKICNVVLAYCEKIAVGTSIGAFEKLFPTMFCGKKIPEGFRLSSFYHFNLI